MSPTRRAQSIGFFVSVMVALATGVPRRADATAELHCVDVRGEARYRNYGYDHIVHLTNRCPVVVVCEVWTNVNPERLRAVVAAGEHVEVLTFRGSPAREFAARAECRRQRGHE